VAWGSGAAVGGRADAGVASVVGSTAKQTFESKKYSSCPQDSPTYTRPPAFPLGMYPRHASFLFYCHLNLVCRNISESILSSEDYGQLTGRLCRPCWLSRLNFLSVQPYSLEAQLVCEHIFKTFPSPSTAAKSILHTYWTFVCNLSAEQALGLRVVLETSNDQDLADGNGAVIMNLTLSMVATA
jgi:hypothetical protein